MTPPPPPLVCVEGQAPLLYATRRVNPRGVMELVSWTGAPYWAYVHQVRPLTWKSLIRYVRTGRHRILFPPLELRRRARNKAAAMPPCLPGDKPQQLSTKSVLR